MADFAARAETELAIKDSYMEANYDNPTAVIDCIKRTPEAAFEDVSLKICMPGAQVSFVGRGLTIDYARDDRGGTDADSTMATLNRSLICQQVGQSVLRRYACGITHPHGIRFIYPYQSTARGISILA